MVVEKEDLGLSLSLSLAPKRSRGSLQLNLMPSLTSSPCSQLNLIQKNSWNQTTHATSSDRGDWGEACRLETRSHVKGIDVNRLPTTADVEEEARVSSPNSTLSSISGNKKSEREANREDHDIERASSRGMSDEEDGETSRKKLRLSNEQWAILEEGFKERNTLNPKQKMALAKKLGLKPRQVEVWFQNRRARTKLKQTEVDFEFLTRCCQNLTEENRRLQKEVQELRSLNFSPHFYMQMTPPTTLTMCPSCERVEFPPSSAPSTTFVDPTAHELVYTHPRPVPLNTRSTVSVAHPPFDGGPF